MASCSSCSLKRGVLRCVTRTWPRKWQHELIWCFQRARHQLITGSLATKGRRRWNPPLICCQQQTTYTCCLAHGVSTVDSPKNCQ
jgi:hypothetical protein